MTELLANPIIQLLAALIAAVIIALFRQGKELLEASGAKGRAEAIKAWNEDLYEVGKDFMAAAKEEAIGEVDEFVAGDRYDVLKRSLIDYGNTTLRRAGLAGDLLTEDRVDAVLRRALEEVRREL